MREVTLATTDAYIDMKSFVIEKLNGRCSFLSLLPSLSLSPSLPLSLPLPLSLYTVGAFLLFFFPAEPRGWLA